MDQVKAVGRNIDPQHGWHVLPRCIATRAPAYVPGSDPQGPAGLDVPEPAMDVAVGQEIDAVDLVRLDPPFIVARDVYVVMRQPNDEGASIVIACLSPKIDVRDRLAI